MNFSNFWPAVAGLSLSIVIALFAFTLLLLGLLWLVLKWDDRMESKRRRHMTREQVVALEEYRQRMGYDR